MKIRSESCMNLQNISDPAHCPSGTLRRRSFLSRTNLPLKLMKPLLATLQALDVTVKQRGFAEDLL